MLQFYELVCGINIICYGSSIQVSAKHKNLLNIFNMVFIVLRLSHERNGMNEVHYGIFIFVIRN